MQKINCGARGEFSFALKKAGKDELIFEKPSKNLILDYFLSAVNSKAYTNSVINSMTWGDIGHFTRVGTGSTPPTPSDISLVNPVLLSQAGTLHSSGHTYDEENNTITSRKVCRTEYAAATQAYNLSEVGVYTSSSPTISPSSPIVSRALITDNQGNPTTITLDVGDILVVFYTLEVTSPAIIERTINIKGQDVLWKSVRHRALNNPYWPWSTSVIYNLKSATANIGINVPRVPFEIFPVGGSASTFPPNSTSIGWFDQNNAVADITPLNPDSSGIRTRQRVNLSWLNGDPIYGFYMAQDGAWCHSFDVGITKTDQEVIEVETFLKLSRI